MFMRFDTTHERDRQTPHDGIAALMHSTARQKSSPPFLAFSSCHLLQPTLQPHYHTHDNAPTYYAIDNETIGRCNTTTSAEPGIEPRVVSTWVNHVTNMPTGIYHECMALDIKIR